MIPLRLTLHNFLSYQQVELDFSSLHTACICGENGAGKSALLEGLTWGIWGQCRVATDDRSIRQGALESRVEVVYQSFGQTYRIIRTRSLQGGGSLEWQIETEKGWRSLTRKGMRVTQQAIQDQLRLDYQTFINSAYLRQGRADEFTLKRPGERKRLLAEMLNLQAYDRLAEQSRERERLAKTDVAAILKERDHLQRQLKRQQIIQQDYQTLLHQQTAYNQAQTCDRQTLQQKKEHKQKLQQAQQQWDWQRQQFVTLKATLQQTETQWRHHNRLRQDLLEMLERKAEIEAGDRFYQKLMAEIDDCQTCFQHRQALLQEQQQLQNQLTRVESKKERAHHTLSSQIETLEGRQKADTEILTDSDRVTTALNHYRKAQANLKRLQALQTEVAPLLTEQDSYRKEIERERQRLQARKDSLEEQVATQSYLTQPHAAEEEAIAIAGRLEELQKLRVYRQRVLEKGQERRSFVEQLQERQRILQRQWQQLEGHCYQLQMPGQSCPLCEQVLQGDQRSLLHNKQLNAQEDISEEIWVIREQLAVADKEKSLLQQEYRDLTEQLVELDGYLERHGRLSQQLEERQLQTERLQQAQLELTAITRNLSEQSFALSARRHLTAIESSLNELNYSDKDLALCRSDMDRWRWAAFKHSEIRKARQRLTRTEVELAGLRSQLAQLDDPAQEDNQAIAQLETQLGALDQRLEELSYDPEHHAQLNQQLQQLLPYHQQAITLRKAQTQLKQCDADCTHLKQLLAEHRQAFNQCQHRYEEARYQLDKLQSNSTGEPQGDEDSTVTVAQLERTISQRRQSLDRLLSQLGAKRQQLQQFATTANDLEVCEQKLLQARRQEQVYRELASAYGQNGIPALIIETVLPKLEAEANRLLARLTHNRLQLQFITQRRSRSNHRTIDTLDILIADPHGTRPYETYSGGEAFRINFAIRLALSRLLAQRSGANLQTLLIDEGFGSQDATGRDRLVAAINAVAPDFACILAITHIPSLRDRFPSRLQVRRTPQGSQLELLS